ncbi:O-fucosyltransferase family protein [Acidobacteriota bacterium]
MLFDADHGGMNNVLVAMQYAAFLAKSSNRILVLPPPQAMWLLDWGPLGIQDSIHGKFHLPTTTTDLNDIVDLSSDTGLQKVVPVRSFREFVFRERDELNLPWNGSPDEQYSRGETDYLTMKIQGERLKEKYLRLGIDSQRGNYFLQRAEALATLNQDNQSTDWPSYACEKFWTPPTRNFKELKEHMERSKKAKVMFFPMDPYIYTKKWRYPRLFDFARNIRNEIQRTDLNRLQRVLTLTDPKFLFFRKNWRTRILRELRNVMKAKVLDKSERVIWDKVSNPRVFHFNMSFFELAADSMHRVLGGTENFMALHNRSREFDKRQEQTLQEVISYLDKIRNRQGETAGKTTLYISTDNPEWFCREPFTNAGINMFLWQDIENAVFPARQLKHIAIVEQIICGFSNVFVGTGGSTFSSQIEEFRKAVLRHRQSFLLPKTRHCVI